MPRKSRIDVPGALHHVIGRGIDRSKIFLDNEDRDDFLDRLAANLKRTKTTCYAWALLPNHFHLLLSTGTAPISALMRRLLTGYAVTFNLRHRRHGHLFQNRYKSILCQEDAYLLELVRYIHLNPLRAGLVEDYAELCRYRYSGHSGILGKGTAEWQDADYILGLFHNKAGIARRKYRAFVEEGVALGRRTDLVGGGLVRSYGGWNELRAMAKSGEYRKGDERILGESDFVQEVLAEASERYERRYRLKAQGVDLRTLAHRVGELVGMKPEEVFRRGKQRKTVQAHGLLCYWATEELGVTQEALAQRLRMTQPAISLAVRRGELLAAQRGWKLLGS
jgi:REP element-mobilizing transposase RayT